MTTRQWHRALTIIGIAALAIRLLYLAEMRHTPFFAVLIGDAKQYDDWARQIASGQWIGTDIFYQTPLYPYLLAVVYKLTGHHVLAIRAMQACFGALSCVLLAIAGRRFFNARVGLIAAALLAIYPPAIFFDGLIQKSSLDLLLMTMMLAIAGECLERPSWRWMAGLGAAFGALMLNRENTRVLYPILAFWIWFAFRRAAPRTRTTWLAIFTAAIAIVLLPVAIRNEVVGHEFVISTSQLGPNLYIGNHEGASGGYEALVDGRGQAMYERVDAERLANEASGRALSPGEVSDYWRNRAFQFMRSQPGAWLKLMGRKLLLTINANEPVDTESLDAYGDYSLILKALGFISFGVMLPLAIIGAWLARAEWRRLGVLHVTFVALGVSVAIFYVFARYRYPMAPIVLLFAAAALSGVKQIGRDWRASAPGLVTAVLVAVICYLPLRTSYDETYFNYGASLLDAGQTDMAIPLLRKAVSVAPDDAPAQLSLGVALRRTGQTQEAIEHLTTATRLRPNYPEAQAAMAMALQGSGDTSDAMAHFEEAVRLQPESPEAQCDLGLALWHAGKKDEAIAHYREALRLKPDDFSAHNDLATALQQEGKPQEAIPHYAAALAAKPDYAGAHSNLALALEAVGNYGGAADHFREAVRLQPNNLGMHVNFGNLLMGVGKMPEGVEQFEAAAKLAPAGDVDGSLDVLELLAQAYARANRLKDAIATLEKARVMAQAAGRTDVAAQLAAAIRSIESQMAGKTN